MIRYYTGDFGEASFKLLDELRIVAVRRNYDATIVSDFHLRFVDVCGLPWVVVVHLEEEQFSSGSQGCLHEQATGRCRRIRWPSYRSE